MNHLFGLALALLIFCGCKTQHSAPPLASGLAKGFALTMQGTDAATPFLSENDRRHLRSIRIFDSTLAVHPLYFDKVYDASRHQVERHYLDYHGNVARTEIITLPADKFWEPITLIALNYEKFGSLPVFTDVTLLQLRAALGSTPGKITQRK